MIPEELATERLTLRPFAADDAADVFDYWRSDSAWERFNASVPEDFRPADADEFVTAMCNRDRSTAPSWALVHRRRVVGVVALTFEQEGRIAVIGYGVHGNLRGRGLCREAADTVIDRAFAHCPDLEKIRAHTDAENTASMRVLMKLGFTHEGTLRKNQFVKNRFVDEAVFGLLRPEWTAR